MLSVAPYRRLLADDRGTAFIEYSSLTLLLAIAAIAVLAQMGDVGVPQPYVGKAIAAE